MLYSEYMNSSDTKLDSTRAQAQYAAIAVRAAKRRDSVAAGKWAPSWGNPFSTSRRIQYKVRSARGWAVRWYEEHIGAEELLREIAPSDPELERFVRKLDSDTTKALRGLISFHAHIENPDKRPPQITDTQRRKVYRAEDRLRTHRLASFADAEQFIQRVVSSDWWQERMGTLGWLLGDTVRVKHNTRLRNTANATWYGRKINLGTSWSWEKTVCLHELAHLLAPRAEEHGPIFAACHILLVDQFIDPATAQQLKAAYLDGGCKIATSQTLSLLFARRADLSKQDVKLEASEIVVESRRVTKATKSLRTQ